MRQNINNNHITYALLIGLLVCGFVVFIATPVVAQDVTNAELRAELKEIINSNTARTNFLFWFIVVGLPAILLFINILITLYVKVNGRLNKLEGVWDVVKSLVDVRFFNKQKPSANLSKMKEKGVKGLASSNSPLFLNEQGRYLLEVVGAKAYIDRHQQEIADAIQQKYKVDLATLKAHQIKGQVERFLREWKQYDIKDTEFQNILAILYQHSLDYDMLIFVMSLELRDRICNQNNIPTNLEQKQRVSQEK